MRLLPTVKDSRGRESHTLLFVGFAAVILNVRFALAGFKIFDIGIMPGMTAIEFGTAFGLVMAVWLGREWTDKVKSQGAAK